MHLCTTASIAERTSSSRYLKHYRNVIIYIIDFLINAEESLSYN